MTTEERKAAIKAKLGESLASPSSEMAYSNLDTSVPEVTTEELQKQLEEQKEEKKKSYADEIFGGKKRMFDAIQRKITKEQE